MILEHQTQQRIGELIDSVDGRICTYAHWNGHCISIFINPNYLHEVHTNSFPPS